MSVRRLQRRFADHVRVSPKAVVRRCRLYEAAERARLGADVAMPPDRYARTGGLGR